MKKISLLLAIILISGTMNNGILIDAKEKNNMKNERSIDILERPKIELNKVYKLYYENNFTHNYQIRFNIPSDGLVTLKIKLNNGQKNFFSILQNLNYEELLYGQLFLDQQNIKGEYLEYDIYLKKGIYGLTLDSMSQNSINYYSVNFKSINNIEYELNNEKNIATEISLNKDYNAIIKESNINNRDYFTFKSENNKETKILISKDILSSLNKFELIDFDNKVTKLNGGNIKGEYVEFNLGKIPQGKYFIKVEGEKKGFYKIKVNQGKNR